MTAQEHAFHQHLVEHRLIVPSAVPGVFGRSARFEDVLQRFDQFVSKAARGDGAEALHFPPVVSRSTFEKSGFLASFPQLAGSVFSFAGSDAQHQELIQRLHAGEEWHDLQSMSEVCLTPAACYPVYPMLTGSLPEQGKLIDVTSYCFRHEPSPDPARMQAFRMREFVRIASPEIVVEWRGMWLTRGVELLRGLGLDANPDIASDPFFGRRGRMLKVNQKDQMLKFEVLVPITSTESPTAVASFNYHQDHFGSLFDIRTSAGEIAHTACLGFGMERVTMALFKTHGFDSSEWPKAVREQLWP